MALSGSGAQQVAQQAGAGPGGQLVAALAGGLAPGAASFAIPGAVRGAVRGTDPTKFNQNVAAFEGAGTTASVGQASESRVMRALESLMARMRTGTSIAPKAGLFMVALGEWCFATPSEAIRIGQ